MPQIKKIESKTDALLEKEEIMWKQQSCINWLRAKDKNTDFFCAKALHKRQGNKIYGARN